MSPQRTILSFLHRRINELRSPRIFIYVKRHPCSCSRWTGMTRRRRCCLLALLLFILTLLLNFYSSVRLQPITLTKSSRRDETVQHFILGRYDDIYLYSAIAEDSAALQRPGPASVVVTALDRSRVSLVCCLLMRGDRVIVYVTPARVYFRSFMTRSTFFQRLGEYFSPSTYLARQYRCEPTTWPDLKPGYVTLTSSTCSSNFNDYVPVVYPEAHPGGLALCAKIAHSPGLDAQKIVEWFEMQRILGVDRILIYNLGVDHTINKIFNHYENLGLLETRPYELPGEPKNRNLREEMKRSRQFTQDETLALLDCKVRMSGYDLVLSHDLDEIVIPRENVSLKQFFKKSLMEHPNAAGFYFFTSFFILDWAKTNPEEQLMVKSFRKSTVPRWECYKFVFIPDRTRTILTHEIFAQQGYTLPTLTPSDVILHHYRKCPLDTWGECSVPTVIDDVMTRYRDLDGKVFPVLADALKII